MDSEYFSGEINAINNLLGWYEELEVTVPVDVLARAHELGIITEEGNVNE